MLFLKFYVFSQQTFKSLNLQQYLNTALHKNNFKYLTHIQHLAIPQILQRKNVLITAQTGSGKTHAYLIPLLNQILFSKKIQQIKTSVLILTATKQLSTQIYRDIKLLDFQNEIKVARTGSLSYFSKIINDIGTLQDFQLKVMGDKNIALSVNWQKDDIIISTPKHFNNIYKLNKKLQNRKPQTIIIDEADLILYSESQLKKITLQIIKYYKSKDLQIILSCATLPKINNKQGLQYMEKLLGKLTHIDYKMNTLPQKLDIRFVIQSQLKQTNKFKFLLNFLQTKQFTMTSIDKGKVLIFCNQNQTAKQLFQKLTHNKIPVFIFTGYLNLMQRYKNLYNFQQSKNAVLISTDVGSRGMNFEVSCVIQYQFSLNVITYINRVGRTGRMGNPGLALSFVQNEENILYVGIKECLQEGLQISNLFSRKRSLSKKLKKMELNPEQEKEQ